MDRTHRPFMESRTIEDHRRTIGADPHEVRHGIAEPRTERFTSGILRELAEQMRHWD